MKNVTEPVEFFFWLSKAQQLPEYSGYLALTKLSLDEILCFLDYCFLMSNDHYPSVAFSCFQLLPQAAFSEDGNQIYDFQ